MRSFIRIRNSVVLFMFLAVPTWAGELVVFGDSWSMRQFADGPVWPNLLASQFEGLSRPRSYAQGGARPNGRIVTQIDSYLAGHTPDADDLIGLWSGAAYFLLDGQADASKPVSDLADRIATLSNAGAKRFLLGTMPVLGKIPWGRNQGEARMDTAATEFSSELREKAEELEQDLGIHIQILDAFTLHGDILADPDGLGFPNPERHGGSLLTDGVHFRTGFHELLANRTARALADFNQDGTLDANDIDAMATAEANELIYDLSFDGIFNQDDRHVFVTDVLQTWFGDSNLDGEFNSSDFVEVFKADQYEDGIPMNSSWATGDWNGDREFDSGDFVFAFKDGGYELGQRQRANAVPEPSISILWLLGFAGLFRFRRRDE